MDNIIFVKEMLPKWKCHLYYGYLEIEAGGSMEYAYRNKIH